MKEWILRHRIVTTSSLVVFGIAISVGSGVLYKRSSETNLDWLETFYYTSQIVSVIYVIAGVIIAVWQYYISFVSSQRDLTVARVQKAIDLSEYYKDNILAYIPVIKDVFNNSEINEVISQIDTKKMIHFDVQEMNEILGKENIEKIKEIQKSDKFIDAIKKANDIYDLGLNPNLFVAEGDKKIDTVSISIGLNKIITKTLNNLEYFAMNFTHKSADDTVIYESLHQTYIGLVQLLYYNISRKNELSTERFFSNIIELYGKWYGKSVADRERFVEDVRKLRDKGTTIE